VHSEEQGRPLIASQGLASGGQWAEVWVDTLRWSSAADKAS